MERRIQLEIIKYLRHKGCYVLKTQPGGGTPTGCPDIVFFKEGFWGALEVKASEKSKFQPLQELTIAKLNAWSYCKVVYPENWEQIKGELQTMLV